MGSSRRAGVTLNRGKPSIIANLRQIGLYARPVGWRGSAFEVESWSLSPSWSGAGARDALFAKRSSEII